MHFSKQCNQAESAITQKVDLTTGHLVKLKTRHLHCTYSLGDITSIDCDWLSGELASYKRQSDSVGDQLESPTTSTFIILSTGGFIAEGEF